VRRSVLLYDALDAWADDDTFERLVEAFVAAGCHEFVVFWPADGRRNRFERAALSSIPRLRS
jgi:hypothetical protein